MGDPSRRLTAILAAAVADERVLRALAAVPRELFVPPALRAQAHDNGALPIGCGQTISQPVVVARMTEALELGDADRVLDVGTGSGYHAAVLAQLAGHVLTIERISRLAARALPALRAAGARNVTCMVGDATAAHHEPGAFEAINVAAAASPQAITRLAAPLAPGGRLVAPLSDGPHQHLVLLRRPASGGPDAWQVLEPVRFVPLVSDADAPAQGQTQPAAGRRGHADPGGSHPD